MDPEKKKHKTPLTTSEAVTSEQHTEPEIEVAEEPTAAVEATRQPVLADAREKENEVNAGRAEAQQDRQQGIAKRSVSPASKETISDTIEQSGKVVSANDGTPLPGVNVIVKGTSSATVTDHDGKFRIAAPRNSTLVFAFIGFESREVKTDDMREMTVSLKEDVNTLSETVIVGYGAEKPFATRRPAAPDIGRSGFKNYLENAVAYPDSARRAKVEGRVIVRFVVGADGTLTNFDVLKGIGHGCDEALIRAIQDGPAWKPAMNGDEPSADTVKVRYRFALP